MGMETDMMRNDLRNKLVEAFAHEAGDERAATANAYVVMNRLEAFIDMKISDLVDRLRTNFERSNNEKEN